MGKVSKSFDLLLISMFLLVSSADAAFAQTSFTTLISPSQTENTIMLSWTPYPSKWYFVSYEVFYLKSPDGWHSFWQSCWKIEYDSGPSSRQHNVTIISGLSPNTTYYFKVVPSGFNEYGHVPNVTSNILEVRTQPTTTNLPIPTPTMTPTSTPSVPEFSTTLGIIPPMIVVSAAIATIMTMRKRKMSKSDC